MENRMLNIETKENSPEKLAAVVGKPTKHFLFAPEINRIVNSINALRNLLIVNQENIEALVAQSESINLGDITGEDFVDVLNQMELVEIGSSALIVYTISDVKYVQTFLAASGNYGTSTSSTLTADQFALIYQSSSESAQPTEYEFLGKLRQVGANDPTIQVLKNTFPIDFQIYEDGAGQYFLYSSAPVEENWFDPSKMTCFLGSPSTNDELWFNGKFYWTHTNTGIIIYSIDLTTQTRKRGYLVDGVSILIKRVS